MKLLCFDTETTGFRADARVLEVGLVFIEDLQIIDSISRYFYPPDLDWNSPQVLEALSVNGLSEQKLRGSPPITSYLDFLEMELAHCDGWLGHNLSFDERMLQQEFARANRSMPECKKFICTLNLARKKGMRGNKLVEVAPRYGVQFTGRAHTAEADAIATAHVYFEMVKRGDAPRI